MDELLDDGAELVIEGFFPNTSANDFPKRAARGGIQEMGLPYVADPAIPRHLAAFLQKHAASGFEALCQSNSENQLPRPDAILLNGGVFNSERLANRLLEACDRNFWKPDAKVLDALRRAGEELEDRLEGVFIDSREGAPA